MSYLVENPEDWFSHDAVHMLKWKTDGNYHSVVIKMHLIIEVCHEKTFPF